MRKTTTLLVLIIAVVMLFSACSKDTKPTIQVDLPVSMEQVNTDGQYVARAYLESLFLGDEAMFDKCYPDGFIDRLEEINDVNVFERYRDTLRINGDIVGTRNDGYVEYTLANGYDEAGMKSRICHVTGFEYSEVGQIRIQKIKACFTNSVETVEADFSFYVYEVNGSWYMLEGVVGQTGT